jgi:hypothetical protein
MDAVLKRLCVPLVLIGAAAGGAQALSVPHTIVLDRSIAGVSLGESRRAIERRIGVGSLVSARRDTSTVPPERVERVAYDAAGVYVTYASAGAARPRGAAGKAVVLETTWTSFRTPQGVGVGSTLKAVKTVPGVRCFGVVCEHGYVGGGAGTSFLIDPVRRKVVRVVIAAGR